MAATLDQIEAAIFAALGALGPQGAAPAGFTHVARWAGEVTARAADGTGGVGRALTGKTPAALLAFAGEETEAGESIETLALSSVQLVGRSTWVVYLVVRDRRGDATATKGAVGLPGLLALATTVANTLAGVRVDGLHRGGNVRYEGARAVLVEPVEGHYVYALRFTAERAIEPVDAPDASVPLDGVDADLNLTDAADAPPDPFSEFTAP